MRTLTALALLVGAALAPGALASPRPKVTGPHAVVAVIDTGINPYHRTFRDRSPRAYAHPSTYLPGFPKDAVALRLTLDAKTYDDALTVDCERIWSKVRPGRLYWFPGTRIVGGIAFGSPAQIDCERGDPAGGPILDGGGHGTMTASRAVSREFGACPECLVVAVHFPGVASLGKVRPDIEAIRWVARNASWIDAQSNSWGPVVPVYDPTGQAGLYTADPQLAKAVEEVSRTHLAFWASGNGAAFRFGVLGHPTLLAPHLGPSALIVGGHDSGYATTWPGFAPHLVSDACASWAARIRTTDESGDSVGSGTSAATPFVAGGAVQVLREARRLLGDQRTGVRGGVVAAGRAGAVRSGPLADGRFTVAEWRDVVLKTATRRPKAQREDGPTCSGQYGATPVRWADVPDQFPEYAAIGYGAVDRPAVQTAFAVLRGAKPLPARPDTDRYFTVDRTARGALHTVFGGP